jgi:hypothetical protein
MPLEGPREWTRLEPIGTPPPPYIHFSVVYDPVRDRILGFGGVEFESPAQDCGVSRDVLWALELSDPPRWQQLHAEGSPGGRDAHAATYDPVGDRMIIAGGEYQKQFMWLGCNYDDLKDTWALSLKNDALTWTRLDENGPYSIRLLADDPVRNRVLTISNTMDVSELSLESPAGWQRVSVEGDEPSPRSLPGWTYDAARDRVLLFGGPANADLHALQFSPVSTQPPIPVSATTWVRARSPLRRGETAIFTYFAAQAGNARLEIHDIAGRLIFARMIPDISVGENRMTLPDIPTPRAGVYLVRMVQNGRSANARWILVP